MKAPLKASISRGLWFILSLLGGGPPRALWQILTTSSRWTKEQTSHRSATKELRHAINRVAPHMNAPSEIGALRRHLGSIGMFSATSGLSPTVQTRLKPLRAYEWRQQVRLAIATGDHHYALELASISNLSSEIQNPAFLEYLSLWVNEKPTGTFGFHVSGPGPLGTVAPTIDITKLPTSQVIMPSASLNFPVNEIDGRTSLIGYANGMTTSWLRNLKFEDRVRALDNFEIVRVKKLEDWMKEDSRFEECLKVAPLYLCGSPNMIPISVIDLLSRFRTRIFVTGTTFFLGHEPYRYAARRYFPEEGQISDEHGSTGGVFERCRAMASHDQIMNRVFLRNLCKAGWVSGDDSFLSALNFEDDRYLEALDEIYGGHRK